MCCFHFNVSQQNDPMQAANNDILNGLNCEIECSQTIHRPTDRLSDWLKQHTACGKQQSHTHAHTHNIQNECSQYIVWMYRNLARCLIETESLTCILCIVFSRCCSVIITFIHPHYAHRLCMNPLLSIWCVHNIAWHNKWMSSKIKYVSQDVHARFRENKIDFKKN